MKATEKSRKEPAICSHSYSEYLQLVRSFHGHLAPGMVLGGFMVDTAYRHLPEGEFFDALCETRACLPDAIQILTPCTVGNGWLRIIDIGRFALTLFEKYGGIGIRVFLDSPKLEPFPELKNWFFKLKPKHEQDFDLLKFFIDKKGVAKIRAQSMAHLKELTEIERTSALFRSYPEYRSPESFKNIVKNLINSGKYRFFMA